MGLRYLLTLLFLLSMLLMSGCTPGIQFNPTYEGEVFPNSAVQNGSVNLDTPVLGSGKAAEYKKYEDNLSQALADAFEKHGVPVAEKGLNEYRLQTHVETLPDMDIWQAKPQLGKNIGLASIPFAGAFISRFYTISTGYKISFDLLVV